VIADGDIIRNETVGVGENAKAIPLGFDRYMNQQFGNKDLITNAVLYLTDNHGWIDLRSKTVALRLLNKIISATQKTKWQIINVAIPPVVLVLFGLRHLNVEYLNLQKLCNQCFWHNFQRWNKSFASKTMPAKIACVKYSFVVCLDNKHISIKSGMVN